MEHILTGLKFVERERDTPVKYQTIRVLKLLLLGRYTQEHFSLLSSKPRLLLCLFLLRVLTQV